MRLLFAAAFVIVLSSIAVLATKARTRLPEADAPLEQSVVDDWFDKSITRGDGAPCVVREQNEVTELVDGVAAFRAMSDAMKTARPNLTVLKTLGGSAGSPVYPREFGSIVEGIDHKLYFTTSQGGAGSRGAICRIGPDGKDFEVLHSFNGMDGMDPRGGMTMAPDGSFYGTTYGGGTLPDKKMGFGTVWKLSADGTQFSSVWTFRNGAIYPPPKYPEQPTEQQKLDAAGSYPVSPPVQSAGGKWYGVTSCADNQQYGVVYTLGGGGSYSGIYRFKAAEAASLGTFGCSMMAGWDGNLYGTTIKGGLGWGTVFKLEGGGGISTLHKFDGAHGAAAYSLIQGKDRYLYGTAAAGGSGNAGVVYRLSPISGDYTIIHTFVASDGSVPAAGLVQAKDGSLYGVAQFQGPTGRGLIFKMSTSGANFRIIHCFAGSMAEGHYCVSAPIQHSNGKLYGVTKESVSPDGGGGVVYSLELEKPDYIYALNWWMTDNFTLYGPNTPMLTTNFTEANNKGVQMRAMLWDQWFSFNRLGFETKTTTLNEQNTSTVKDINGYYNGAAILDNKTLDWGSHHQKILVVKGSQGLIGFCGGADFNPDRIISLARQPGSPMHDVHCRIKGPAAGDLLQIFVDRWKDHPSSKELDDKKDKLSGDPVEIPGAIPGASCSVQVGRTFGNGTANAGVGGVPFLNNKGYSFASNGDQSAARIILHGINHAKNFIYVEDQYFVDTADPAQPSTMSVRNALMAKLKDPLFQHLIILLPHGNISDMPQVKYRRNLLITALKEIDKNKVHVFYRGPVGDGTFAPSHSYVHAKVWIFDDQFAVIGSVNTNRRSWTHDSEVAVGICDKGNGVGYRLPHRLRMRLWAEHLNIGTKVGGIPTGYESQLSDPLKGIDFWIKNRPLTAYVQPYEETEGIDRSLINPKEWDFTWNTVIDPNGS